MMTSMPRAAMIDCLIERTVAVVSASTQNAPPSSIRTCSCIKEADLQAGRLPCVPAAGMTAGVEVIIMRVSG